MQVAPPKKLNLNENSIGDEAARALADALIDERDGADRVEHSIGDEAEAQLRRACEGRSLQISLSVWCGPARTGAGCASVADVCRMGSQGHGRDRDRYRTRREDASVCVVVWGGGCGGAVAVAAVRTGSAWGTGLKKLMLYDNSIGDEAMAELRRACECSSPKISFLSR